MTLPDMLFPPTLTAPPRLPLGVSCLALLPRSRQLGRVGPRVRGVGVTGAHLLHDLLHVAYE